MTRRALWMWLITLCASCAACGSSVQCDELVQEDGDACAWRFEGCSDDRVYLLRCDPETSCECASGPLPCDDECPSVEKTVDVESCRAEDVDDARRTAFANASCGWNLTVDD